MLPKVRTYRESDEAGLRKSVETWAKDSRICSRLFQEPRSGLGVEFGRTPTAYGPQSYQPNSLAGPGSYLL